MSDTGSDAPEAAGMNAEEQAAAANFVATKDRPSTGKGKKGKEKKAGKGPSSRKDKHTRPEEPADTAPSDTAATDFKAADDSTADAADETPEETQARETAEAEATAKAETKAKEETEARRIGEVRKVSQTVLNRTYREKIIGPDGKQRKPASPEETALLFYHQLGHDKEVSVPFVKGAGKDIILPQPNSDIPDPHGGKAHKIGSGELRLARIVRADGDNLICTFDNIKGGGRPIVDSQGKPLEMSYPREIIIDAQLAAERGLYEGLLEGNERAVLAARIDSLPQSGRKLPGAEIDTVIEATARTNKQMTANSIKESAYFKDLPDDKKAELEKVLDGVTVLTVKEWQAVAPILGLDRTSIAKRADELSAAIVKENEKLKANPDDKYAQAKIQELQTELNMVAQADEALKPRPEDGKSATDDVFEKLQNGELTPAQAEAIINGLGAGDISGVIESIEKSQNLTDGQKTWLKENGKKIGGGILWAFLIGAVAIPAVAIASIGAAAGAGARSARQG